jgi:hypothetical protein
MAATKYKGWVSKAKYRAAQVAAHNAEFERLQARTSAEKDAELREMIRGVLIEVTGDANRALFGNGKPKKVKRWK